MPSVAIPAAALAHARETTRALHSLGLDADAEELLCGRAAMLGLRGGGRTSAGGATRLMRARDGWCALTLSRPDDIDAVPALVECDHVDDPWDAVECRVRACDVASFAARARLLGLPVGVLGETAPAAPVIRPAGEGARPTALADALVVDLSSMWAGPLCGALLARAGATVVKVESAARPDGTRSGATGFFDWINGEKLCYEVDLDRPEQLRRLLAAADVVIESSRPAALRRRGLGPLDGAARAGRVWLRITGHGTVGERADWVAFGDDAAVSGGLVSGAADAPVFCGDAIADPLTGLHAAEAVMESRIRGGGEVVEMSMAAVAAGYAHLPRGDDIVCTAVPSVRRHASAPGADNAAVDRMVAHRQPAAC
ncbi:putative acyl-CoA transferase/carnitine dehydratase [Mycolicibacterium chubuense NBB4]|uniref:Putative acyl-CoA transferase/carnitine dehydratase n=1 Tax=Mycolicibacterium chubuense (strain NBB4) TaxID=710421 RepID=I4BCL8_MYCCN|nr:CoA transferase [Mycolicibacterium chubuense]AFM15025.1 putative acyl-CoA transferase/carnitine dehydratase [Mycolicibacterium chubuense NBB4]